MILEQRKYLKRRIFELNKTGLNIKERYLLKRNEYEVPFEHIIHEPIKYYYTSKVKLWITIILGFFFSIAFYEQFNNNFPKGSVLYFYGTLAIVGFLGYWLSKEELFLFNTTSLSFVMYSNRPSEEEVQEFLTELYKEREKYFDNVFTVTPTNISTVDEIYKLNYLLKEKAITEDEFEKLKAEIFKRNSIRDNDISQN
jgi:hypothetical protein